jgi:hypothetical protein
MKQSEFRYWQRKKPTSHLEPKVRNVKYIGELVKFKVKRVYIYVYIKCM